MENFLLVMILGVLAMYFFSSMSIYKTLYRKVNEEKNLLSDDSEKYQGLVKKLEHQLKSDASAMKGSYDNLSSAREETQELRLENQNLKQKIDKLEKRTDELYAQVNTLV
ncbi:MAG: hypothetical protein HRT40_07010 [Campylobacteraceae bacterium]|nr:hypothetical protein [Campylobacteraceae bacterium]